MAELYDAAMSGNNDVHDLVYPQVHGTDEYVGQFSDDSVSELRAMAAGSAVLDIGCGTAIESSPPWGCPRNATTT